MIDSTSALNFDPPAAAESQQVILLTPPAFGQLSKEAQRMIWENWKRQRVSVLGFEFWALTGVNPKSLQGD